jgi:hypothetical protein
VVCGERRGDGKREGNEGEREVNKRAIASLCFFQKAQ